MKEREWYELDPELSVNVNWLTDGFIVVSSASEYNPKVGSTELQVGRNTILSRQTVVGEADNSERKQKTKLDEAVSFFSVLQEFAQRTNQPQSQTFTFNSNVYFENKNNQDVFIPIVYNDPNTRKVQFYISPFTDIGDDFPAKFNGIKVFVTAGCMFGALLEGIGREKSSVPIVQHRIKLVPGERIVNLRCPKDKLHPYEMAQFQFIKDILPLMEKISDRNSWPKLVYHLPDFDYVLSAVKMFIHNQITYEALIAYYSFVKRRSKIHTENLTAIFENADISLQIQSPFMNLFQNFLVYGNYEIFWEIDLAEFENREIKNENEIYVIVKNGQLFYKRLNPFGRLEESVANIKYTELDLSLENIEEISEQLLNFIENKDNVCRVDTFLAFLGIPNSEKPFIGPRNIEKAVVVKILYALTNNEFAVQHQSIWVDLLKIYSGKEEIDSLEKLFQVANAMMIALAAKGQDDYTVCSFLPLSEKPIFNNYDKCNRKLNSYGIIYPEVLSLVVIERLIGFSMLGQGNVFYLQHPPRELVTGLENGVLTNPSSIFGFFGKPQKKNARLKTPIIKINDPIIDSPCCSDSFSPN